MEMCWRGVLMRFPYYVLVFLKSSRACSRGCGNVDSEVTHINPSSLCRTSMRHPHPFHKKAHAAHRIQVSTRGSGESYPRIHRYPQHFWTKPSKLMHRYPQCGQMRTSCGEGGGFSTGIHTPPRWPYLSRSSPVVIHGLCTVWKTILRTKTFWRKPLRPSVLSDVLWHSVSVFPPNLVWKTRKTAS